MPSAPQPAPWPVTPPEAPAPRPQLVPEPAPRGPRRWRFAAILAGIGLLLGGLYLALRQTAATKTGGIDIVQTATASVGPLERVVRVSGQTSARNYATIMVPAFRGPDSGRDLTLMKCAKPGAFVRKGEIVAELDPQNLKDHIDDVEDQVSSAANDIKKKVAEQQVEWTALEQNVRVAKAYMDAANLDLKAAEVKTDIERELMRLTAEEATATYTQLQADLARKKAADKAEIRMLEITLHRQKIHLGNHTSDLTKFSMRTPMDGLVVMSQVWRSGEMKQIQEGDQLTPGMQFMKIVDTSSMQLEAVVSQADASEFRLGQVATVGLDAFPGLTFQGKVYSIGAMAVKGVWDTYYIRNVPVRIMIEGRDPRLIPDLSAWAHVRLDQQQDALLVPAEAVRKEQDSEVVYVKNGGNFERRPVEIAMRTPTSVAIRSGLRPGEQVALGKVK